MPRSIAHQAVFINVRDIVGCVQKLTRQQIETELEKLTSSWQMTDGRLVLKLKTANFKKAIALINKVAKLADKLDHHPDLNLHSYNNLKITIYTHQVDGLTKRDFTLATHIDKFRY